MLRFLNQICKEPLKRAIFALTIASTALGSVPLAAQPKYIGQQAGPSPVFQSGLNANTSSALRGVVDVHTHPMTHLAFGGIMHGGNHPAALMPGNMIDCDIDEMRNARGIHEALSSDQSAHEVHVFPILFGCGNKIRGELVKQLEKAQGASGRHSEHDPGYPNFKDWPHHASITHQQMYVDWLRAARDGGLRAIVALAVNSYTLAKAAQAGCTECDEHTPFRNKENADLQIEELKRFVSSYDFMEIAYSPEDYRRIVKADKLAIVIGIELDDIGNFNLDLKQGRISRVTPKMVRDEIDRLHNKGVRYIFPMHLTDSVFGGTALYNPIFNAANRVELGRNWKLECAPQSLGVNKVIEYDSDLALSAVMKAAHGSFYGPDDPVPCVSSGHINKLGLTSLGNVLVEHLMRKGIMIDADHMSHWMKEVVIKKARAAGYPLSSGHAGLREARGTRSEADMTEAQYHEIARFGGMAGIGWNGQSAQDYLKELLEIKKRIPALNIALGSDIMGLVKQPPAPTNSTEYLQRSLPKQQTGNRVWDYNKDGVAHVGLFPHFLAHLEEYEGGKNIVDELFDSAESFAQMWESSLEAGQRFSQAPSFADQPLIPLMNLYHPGREDNFLTSDPQYTTDPENLLFEGRSIKNPEQMGDYARYRLEGMIFHPRKPQPDGTVPLFSLWDPKRGDNFATTDPRYTLPLSQVRWRGEHIAGVAKGSYTVYRLEGFVYDPKKPQPAGTVPLFRLWSAERGDNFTTTDNRYGMAVSTIEWRNRFIVDGPKRSGYTISTLEGYVLKRPPVSH